MPVDHHDDVGDVDLHRRPPGYPVAHDVGGQVPQPHGLPRERTTGPDLLQLEQGVAQPDQPGHLALQRGQHLLQLGGAA